MKEANNTKGKRVVSNAICCLFVPFMCLSYLSDGLNYCGDKLDKLEEKIWGFNIHNNGHNNGTIPFPQK